MPLYNPSFVAGGDIFPASFVTVTGEFTVSQVSATTEPIIGVAQEGTFDPPNLATLLGGTESKLAAKEGRTLKVFGLGDVCMVRSSGNITAGSKVRAYTGGTGNNATLNGGAITIGTTAGTWQVGGTALNTVVAGEKVLIQVNPHVVVIPTV